MVYMLRIAFFAYNRFPTNKCVAFISKCIQSQMKIIYIVNTLLTKQIFMCFLDFHKPDEKL